MYKQIMVPIDNSDTAMAAFAHALSLAKCVGSELTLVHVEDVSRKIVAASLIPNLDLHAYSEQTQHNIAHSKGLLEHLSHDAQTHGVKCNSTLVEKWGGDPAETLLNCARDIDADLIIMGTHGYSVFKRLFFGNVTESLLESTTIPVLVIRSAEIDDDDE